MRVNPHFSPSQLLRPRIARHLDKRLFSEALVSGVFPEPG